jgi:hypothetical protein
VLNQVRNDQVAMDLRLLPYTTARRCVFPSSISYPCYPRLSAANSPSYLRDSITFWMDAGTG